DIDAQRNDAELLAPTHSKYLADLAALLFTDHNDSVCTESRERALDSNEQASLCGPVIAVKDMAVVGMHYPAAAGSQHQRGGSRPFIDHCRNATRSTGLCFVSMNDVGPKPEKQKCELCYHNQIADAEFAAHLLHDNRFNTVVGGKVAHIAFAGRNGP